MMTSRLPPGRLLQLDEIRVLPVGMLTASCCGTRCCGLRPRISST